MSSVYNGEILESISVDVSRINEFAPKIVKQKDAYTHGYIVTLTDNGQPLQIPTANTQIWFNCQNQTDTSKKASVEGTILENGTVKVKVPATVMDVAGYIQCDISVITIANGNTHILKSTLFYLMCEAAANPDGTSSAAESTLLAKIISGEISLPGGTSNITIMDYETASGMNFELPTSYPGEVGDVVIMTTSENNHRIGGAIWWLKYIDIVSGTTYYRWIEVPSAEDLEDKEDVNNKVTSLSSSSTDSQYPSAKCVYDFVTGQIGDLSSKMDLASINPTAEQIAAMSTGQIYDETDDGVVTIKGGTELLGVLIAQFNPEYGIKGKVGQIARYGNNFYQCFGQNEQGTYVWKLISFAGSDVIKARATTTGALGDYIISSSTTLQEIWELFTKYHCVKVALTNQYGTPTGQVCWITNVTGNNKEELSAFMLPELSSSSSPVAPVYQKIHFLEQNASSPSDTLRLVTKYVYPPYEDYYTADEIDEKIGDIETLLSEV